MCKRCVDSGLISQEQMERIQDGEDVEDVLSQEELTRWLEQDTSMVFSGNLEDAPEFVRNLMESRRTPQDPEKAAQDQMDQAADVVLKWMKGKLEMAQRAAESDGRPFPDSARTQDAFLEMLAGELMFRNTPASIAYTLALVTDRYIKILDQWSTLYVAAAKDVDDLAVDLDQAETPEAKTATVRAADMADLYQVREGKYQPRGGGMYI